MEANNNLPALQLPENGRKFLEIFAPHLLNAELSKKGITTAYLVQKNKTISLATIKQAYGTETLFDYVLICLVQLNNFVSGNSNKLMTEFQLQETATLIIDDYYYLDISELSLIFKKIKSAKYGKIYGEINGVFILEAFSQYFNERVSAINKIKMENEKAIRDKMYAEQKNFVPMPDFVKKRVENMNKKFKI